MTTSVTSRTTALTAKKRGRNRLAGAARLVFLGGLVAITGFTILRRPALDEAEVALARNDVRKALRLALDDLDTHRRSPESARIAGRSLSALLYGGEAEPYYKIAASQGMLSEADRYARVQGLITSNRPDQAIAVCREILGKQSGNVAILRLLAFTHWLRGEFVEAEATAETLVKTTNGQTDGLGLLAMIHHEAKHPQKAILASESLLAIDPELKTYRPGAMIFWHDYTDDLVQVHRSADARRYLEKIPPIDRGSDLLDILAFARKELGDTEGAEQAWRESIRRDPSRLNPLLQLGRMLVGIKRFRDAAEVLERAVKLAPGNLESHYLLSRAYQFLGRESDADHHRKRAEEIRRASPAPIGGMGPSK